MKTRLTLNKEDIVDAVSEKLAKKKQKMKASNFRVEPSADAMGRPTGSYTVELDVEVEDDYSTSQR